jgi:hypothetical protein
MKLTAARYAELHDKMTQRLGQRVREMIEPRTIASRLYPNLVKPKPVEQPNRGPIDGWAHLRKPK